VDGSGEIEYRELNSKLRRRCDPQERKRRVAAAAIQHAARRGSGLHSASPRQQQQQQHQHQQHQHQQHQQHQHQHQHQQHQHGTTAAPYGAHCRPHSALDADAHAPPPAEAMTPPPSVRRAAAAHMAPMHAPAPTRAPPTPPSARRAAAAMGGAPPRGAFHERLEQYARGAAAPFSLDSPGMYAEPHMCMCMCMCMGMGMAMGMGNLFYSQAQT